MDSLTFIANVVASLAWPCTVLAISWLLRKQILGLLPQLRKVKAGPVEAEFEREVAQIKQESALQLPSPVQPAATDRKEQLVQLAGINRRAAILEAWQGIEFALRRAGLQQLAGSPPPDVSSPVRVVRELSQAGVLSADDIALFHELRGLRNQATHAADFNPTFEAAVAYIELASRLQARFEALAGAES